MAHFQRQRLEILGASIDATEFSRKNFWSCSPSEAVALVEGGGANIFWWKCHKETSSSMSGRVRMLNFSFRSLFLVSKKD